VGAWKKARQWMEYDEIDVEKIGRTVKIKIYKTNRKEQYREILTQQNKIQKENQNKNKTNETKYKETKENIK
jgi:DNA-directed RNA polymerase delta subunit